MESGCGLLNNFAVVVVGVVVKLGYIALGIEVVLGLVGGGNGEG